ncbi:hypothetical protein DIURU_004860 [Diutina rugosa]|uniref:UDENN FLCN/SMCR8-type domain-containing protein n=1 Tax=Diutina rugosa TaxID=5481 RepID=A0A642UHS7_DIURU|nr:uncharacterized protein DIURU_004860 [Diutina rugosa]KAA8898007.1 hypothetical protein DIURU_004860 [Diutina rugosa]
MTNYITCLAHFCEVHGPSIVACSQRFSPAEHQRYLLNATASSKSRQQTCASCQLVLPDDAANVTSALDHDVVVSAQYPASQKRFSALSKLALKALSCEASSDITKPVYYGDPLSGYCMFKLFKVKDICARGGERKYALMVVANYEPDVLMHWNVISLYFSEIVELIQHKIKEDEETKPKNVIDHERYLRRQNNRPKSMVEITNDPKIFVRFHLWAVEMFKDIT